MIIEFLKNGSGIHIKEKNKGKFTKSAKAAGQSVQEHAKSVLNDPNATPLQKKRANFARNAAKWKHQNGGNVVFAKSGIKAGQQAKQNLTKRKAPDWDNLDRGYRYLTQDMNLPHDQAIAIMGNVVEESQGNYKAVQKNGGGRGLIQWDGQPAPTGRYGQWGKIWASVAKPANVYDSKTDTIKNYWAPWNGLKGEQVRQKFINAPLRTKTKIYAESYLRPGKPRIADRQLSAMQLDSVYNPKIKNIIVNKEGGIIKAQEGTNLFEANKEIIPLSLQKKFFKQVYQDELNKNKLISAITGNVINTSPIVAEHEAFKLASQEAAGLNEQIKRNNKILEAQKLAQQSSDISNLIGDGLGIIADYFTNKTSNKTSTGTSSGTSSLGTSNYKVDSFWTNPSLSGGNQFKVNYTFK